MNTNDYCCCCCWGCPKSIGSIINKRIQIWERTMIKANGCVIVSGGQVLSSVIWLSNSLNINNNNNINNNKTTDGKVEPLAIQIQAIKWFIKIKCLILRKLKTKWPASNKHSSKIPIYFLIEEIKFFTYVYLTWFLYLSVCLDRKLKLIFDPLCGYLFEILHTYVLAMTMEYSINSKN